MNIQNGLAALQAEDLSNIIRITRRKLEQEGRQVILKDDEAVIALKQYYALPLLAYPRQQFAISSVVDSYWHFHVLDTRGYRDFCHRVYGCFMHHVPMDPDDRIDFVRVRNLYKQTRALLVQNFVGAVSERAYPILRGNDKDVVICRFDYCVTGDLFDNLLQADGDHYTMDLFDDFLQTDSEHQSPEARTA